MSTQGSATSAREEIRERAELTLSGLDSLPALPAAASHILKIVSSDGASPREIVEWIQRDAALAAGILRMLRRADLGVSTKITGMDRAVALLGIQRVRHAVLTLQLFEQLRNSTADAGARDLHRELWKHNLAVATVAEKLAAARRPAADCSEAFVCGLLHDIGKQALLCAWPKSYARAVALAEDGGLCICDAEVELFGLDHTLAGKRILTRWQLPRPIVDCAWLHHLDPASHPPSLACGPLLETIHLADEVVRRLRIGFSGYRPPADVDRLAEQFGIAQDRLVDLERKLPTELAPLFELIGEDGAIDHALYAKSLVKAHRELLENAESLNRVARTLEDRTAVLEGLRSLQASMGPEDRLADACQGAADAVKSVMGAEAAAVVMVTEVNGLFQAGFSCEPFGAAGHRIVSDAETAEAKGFAEAIESQDSGVMVSASTAIVEWWSRHSPARTSVPLWRIPIRQQNRNVGAILVACPPDRFQHWASAQNDLDVLRSAIGELLFGTHRRCEAERLNQELVDLHRRLQTAQADLLRQRSLSMIAEMAAGAAHELHNPLAVISGRAQLELERSEDPELTRVLQVIVEQTQRASQIVMDLMAFARPEPPSSDELKLVGFLDRIAQQRREAAGLRSEQLTIRLADSTVTVAVDPAHLTEILHALLNNALEACPRETARVHINSPSRSSDEKVRIVVADNGVGMSRRVLEHAADPFYSSRPAGRGRGMGLTRAHRLVEINGGRLWIESEVDRGTSVSIELPSRLRP